MGYTVHLVLNIVLFQSKNEHHVGVFLVFFQLFLTSDKATFAKCAKKSRHNEVSLVKGISYLAQWKITAFDPDYRLEMEYAPVPVKFFFLFVHLVLYTFADLEIF